MTMTKCKAGKTAFVLREHRLSDADNLFKYQQDSEIQKNFITVPKDLFEAKKEIFEKSKRVDTLSYVIDIDGRAVGEIGFHHIKPKHFANISFWLAKDYRGKGITTKAVKIVTDIGFKKYKVVRIQCNIRPFNKATIRVLKKNKYKHEGTLRKSKFKDGKFLDDMIWAKVK